MKEKARRTEFDIHFVWNIIFLIFSGAFFTDVIDEKAKMLINFKYHKLQNHPLKNLLLSYLVSKLRNLLLLFIGQFSFQLKLTSTKFNINFDCKSFFIIFLHSLHKVI